MFAALTFTGCDTTETPGDDTGNGNGNGNGGGNTGDVRLVDKIRLDNSNSSYGDLILKFSYDDQNRIIKIEEIRDYFEENEYKTYTYSYGANTLSVTLTTETKEEDYEDERTYWRKSIDNLVYNLNAQGLIASREAYSSKLWIDGVFMGDYSESTGRYEFIYENGYSKTFKDSYEQVAAAGSFVTTEMADEFFWSDGNLTRIKEIRTVTFPEGYGEDDILSTNERTYTYSDQPNPVNVSVDLTVVYAYTYANVHFAETMGFLGKSSAKLVSSSIRSYDDGFIQATNYFWTLDSEGYITKMASIDDVNTRIMTVTYKN